MGCEHFVRMLLGCATGSDTEDLELRLKEKTAFKFHVELQRIKGGALGGGRGMFFEACFVNCMADSDGQVEWQITLVRHCTSRSALADQEER